MQIYTVKGRDTVQSLAQQNSLSPEAILAANGMLQSEPLVSGQSLILPVEVDSHQVMPGESLWLISQKYGVTLQELARVNHITNPALILPGMRLRIPNPRKMSIEVNGYTEPSSSATGVTVPAAAAARHLTFLSPFSYQVRPDGTLSALHDQPIIKEAYRNRATPMMVITNFDGYTFSPSLAHFILSNEAVIDRLIWQIISVMRANRYWALNVDFAFIQAADRKLYHQFLERLASSLHAIGCLVSSTLPPSSSPDQEGQLFEGQDYAAQGQILDFVILMTYEWGWAGGPPMPVAPRNEVAKVLHYALSLIPASKIVLGMPLYGYDWTLPYIPGQDFALSISANDAVRIAAKYGTAIHYDLMAESPYYGYRDEYGRDHQVWFEDARSVQAKLDLVKCYHLRGISGWVLDIPFPAFWQVLEHNFHIQKWMK
ncbi:glycosyl hydrolase family 18 protein [Paenibacillus glycanilyticus]|uniref:LysM peptidoglycan-binding domain-containing protein n=1 Tax=Paenibacillus glycanilyticus TaxID=126569 RepID=UPI00203B3B0F|nr:LysM peptidoglycan-binding domain-containing protein [Paenibacillus glycanilyticus]MCM3630861.1 glycosyl hydrolase family 18 protein [Paenibacillus glycanilyticus]